MDYLILGPMPYLILVLSTVISWVGSIWLAEWAVKWYNQGRPGETSGNFLSTNGCPSRHPATLAGSDKTRGTAICV